MDKQKAAPAKKPPAKKPSAPAPVGAAAPAVAVSPAWATLALGGGPILQRKCACGTGDDSCHCHDAPLQRKAAAPGAATAPAPRDAVPAGGRPLDGERQRRFSRAFGYDFGGVTVHTGPAA